MDGMQLAGGKMGYCWPYIFCIGVSNGGNRKVIGISRDMQLTRMKLWVSIVHIRS